MSVKDEAMPELTHLATIIQRMPDPRRTSKGNIRHKLVDIVVIGLCSVICRGDSFEAMEYIGHEREAFFRTFLELPNGIPDADTFRRVFERLNPRELASCLNEWLGIEHQKRCVVAIDGKTIRGSENGSHKAFHVVSAFVAENQLTLGELTVPEKTNEIAAIPELLDLIDVEGGIVTLDAMGCQKKIVEKIRKCKADYAIALKGNQGEFHSDVALYFQEFAALHPAHTTVEKGHGRVETREYRLCTDVKWLDSVDRWKGLNGIGVVRSTVYRPKEKKETVDTRYFITSLQNVEEFAHAVRKHWGIENQLHWNLDVIFREDDSLARKDNSPQNLNILRKIAMRLLNAARTGRMTKKLLMLKASFNPDAMLDVLFQRNS